MNWYDAFNAIEAGLWVLVAGVVAIRVPCQTRQQRFAVLLGSVSFLAFAGTDVLEIGQLGTFPAWLWGLKIVCGVTILASRYTWLGWNRFHWTDREVRFGIACLIGVAIIIVLQRWLDTPRTSRNALASGLSPHHGPDVSAFRLMKRYAADDGLCAATRSAEARSRASTGSALQQRGSSRVPSAKAH